MSHNNTGKTDAKLGSTVTVSFTSERELAGTPVVTIAGRSAAVSGTWPNYTASRALDVTDVEEEVAFAISLTDMAGNTSATPVTAITSGAVVAYDRTLRPRRATPDLAAADDTGRSATDNITTTPPGSPSAAARRRTASVQLYDGAAAVGAPVAATGGAWSTDLALAAGSHSLRATVTDAAGNEATSAALAVTVDTSAPAAPSAPNLAAADDTGRRRPTTSPGTPPRLLSPAPRRRSFRAALRRGGRRWAARGRRPAGHGASDLSPGRRRPQPHGGRHRRGRQQSRSPRAALALTVDAMISHPGPPGPGRGQRHGAFGHRQHHQETTRLTFSGTTEALAYCSSTTERRRWAARRRRIRRGLERDPFGPGRW